MVAAPYGPVELGVQSVYWSQRRGFKCWLCRFLHLSKGSSKDRIGAFEIHGVHAWAFAGPAPVQGGREQSPVHADQGTCPPHRWGRRGWGVAVPGRWAPLRKALPRQFMEHWLPVHSVCGEILGQWQG